MKQLVFDLKFTKFLDWENFYISETNIDAVKWLRWFDSANSNILLLYGEAYCGKSHLGKLWKESRNAKEISFKDMSRFPTDTFDMNNYFFVDDYRILMMNEEWSFHFVNKILFSGKKMLILAREHVFNWHFKILDLKSRFLMVPCAKINPPDIDLMLKISRKMLLEFGIIINEKKLIYNITNLERSYEAIIKFVEKFNQDKLQK